MVVDSYIYWAHQAQSLILRQITDYKFSDYPVWAGLRIIPSNPKIIWL